MIRWEVFFTPGYRVRDVHKGKDPQGIPIKTDKEVNKRMHVISVKAATILVGYHFQSKKLLSSND